MPDDIDRAKDLEMMQRDNALAAALRRGDQPPQITDDNGDVICIDCHQKIPEARLEVKPDAARCVGCKEAFEVEHRQAV